MKPRLLTPIERRVVRVALSRQIAALERTLDDIPEGDDEPLRDYLSTSLATARSLKAIFGRLEID